VFQIIFESGLFHQHHFTGGAESAGAHAVEIDSAAHGVAGGVSAVPGRGMVPGRKVGIYEGGNQLAFLVVDFQGHGAGLGQFETDHGAGVEGIGEIAVEPGIEFGNGVVRHWSGLVTVPGAVVCSQIAVPGDALGGALYVYHIEGGVVRDHDVQVSVQIDVAKGGGGLHVAIDAEGEVWRFGSVDPHAVHVAVGVAEDDAGHVVTVKISNRGRAFHSLANVDGGSGQVSSGGGEHVHHASGANHDDFFVAVVVHVCNHGSGLDLASHAFLEVNRPIMVVSQNVARSAGGDNDFGVVVRIEVGDGDGIL